ncbi:SDR family NAD(P)-dependent oxidoreductase [Luminiphilus sp. nBUS_16]|uniref:SDR family NAD(P)-dependent oxidoreductase n=1 Tax=Luminiphilus sp. nBUS_16 TaxID=3395315 RepID=UPI003EB8ADAE
MDSLKNKVAIVTGAAHPMGMGYATACALSRSGARVVLTDLVQSSYMQIQLKTRVADIVSSGGEAMALAVDVTDRQQIDHCISSVTEHFGSIDVLFNNAGSPAGCGDFLCMTDQQWDISYRVNLKGMADFCQAALPGMISRGGGAIVNNASLSGLGAAPLMAAYTATKFAVVGLTKALAAEFGRHKIRVNAICPGMIWTQMGQSEVEHLRAESESFEEAKNRLVGADLVPLERWAGPEEVASSVVFLSSDAASYINGVALPVAGGMAPGL